MSRRRRAKTLNAGTERKTEVARPGGIRTVVLVSKGGARIKEYWCERLFGRVEYDGRWFRSGLMKKHGPKVPLEHVYLEEGWDDDA